MAMNEEIRDRWVAFLRDPARKQTTIGKLHIINANGDDEYCCLGGLCELAYEAGIVDRVLVSDDSRSGDGSIKIYRYSDNKSYDGDEIHYLPLAVSMWAGLGTVSNPSIGPVDGWSSSETSSSSLGFLNDDGMPFSQIADLIEQRL